MIVCKITLEGINPLMYHGMSLSNNVEIESPNWYICYNTIMMYLRFILGLYNGHSLYHDLYSVIDCSCRQMYSLFFVNGCNATEEYEDLIPEVSGTNFKLKIEWRIKKCGA